MKHHYIAFGQPKFGADEIRAVNRVLKSGWIGMGQEVLDFEKELSESIEIPHVVTVNSCTSALFLSLKINGIKPGDEVICPSFTWCSTANAVLYLDAIPVFADISPKSFNISIKEITARITKKTRAIIVVHMGGLAVDVHKLRKKLPKKIRIIEDAAHAFGARYPNGKIVGSSGNLTCFSFYANKNLSTGEGGAIALSDSSMANRISLLRQHGMSKDAWRRYSDPEKDGIVEFHETGYKMNYTDLQAAIGRVQLRRQDVFSKTRLRIAKRYQEYINNSGLNLITQRDILAACHARHLYQVLLPPVYDNKKRIDLVTKLHKCNIGASIHYTPLHQFSIYKKYKKSKLPITESIGARIITLPIGARMKMSEVNYIAEKFLGFLK